MNPLSYIISALMGALVGYLAVAFYEVSFDIRNWSEGSRLACILTMFWMAFAAAAAVVLNKVQDY